MADFACPLCDSRNCTVLESEADWMVRAAASHDERALIGSIVASDPELSFGGVVRCCACGLATVRTPPGPDALGRFYSAYYASDS
ncbi:MAG: hypothetical protein AAF311_04715, partial [Pseudomonadota bacterium]